jgi:phage gpG-like protein
MSQAMPTDELAALETVLVEVAAAFAAADYTQLLTDFAGELEAVHATYFAAAQGPGGETWPSLSPATVRRKGHDALLVDQGRLIGSLAGQSGDSIREIHADGNSTTLLFGTSLEYSAFHDRGAGRIPARPHVGIDEATIDQLAEAAADEVVAALRES